MKISTTNGEGCLHKAVILGLYFTGYGAIRELSEYNIPIHVFDIRRTWPERVTRLPNHITFIDNEEELLQQLIDLAGREAKKPVMYLTSDKYVDFFKRHREVLEDVFLIDFPEYHVVDTLLKKGDFSSFAEEHGYNIPKTFIINSLQDYDQYSEKITYPCLVKPFWRDESWQNSKLPKVCVFDSKSELEKGLDYITKFESNLIIQQYIPGGDKEVYFHLMYYNSESECIAEFTGRKLRQWPVGVGSTACAEPAPWATGVREESVRLFNQLEYKGFGSVEYKRDPHENKFYITEPTVGRQNAQSFLAAINGTSMSMAAYSALTGNTFDIKSKPKGKTFWIDDQFDFFSILVSLSRGTLDVKDVFRSYLGRKKFRLFNFKDMRVSFYCWVVVLFNKLFQKIRKKFILKIRY